MIRLYVTVEGPTEKRFVNRLLGPHLHNYKVYANARCVLTSRDNQTKIEYRGGSPSYLKTRKDIKTWIAEDNNPECRFTTMFDLYALREDFPGKEEANRQTDPYAKVRIIEEAFSEDIGDHRFIPYIQLHEFETLIFSDPGQLAMEHFESESAIANLVGMLKEVGGNPELLNDGYETCPSRRILKEIPDYDKANAGIIIAEKIGLPKMRSECSHFNNWLTQLENL
ncbi:MAG: DUF4276 family protein [Candidatus Sabulitectum sp.]|nr:DUF4276 family protein [Candidatus Sabulitectum sp.]